MRSINEISGIIGGIFLLLGINILVFVIVVFLSVFTTATPILGIPILCIGLFQFLYVIPISFSLRRQQRWGLMKGVIIGAVLTALLNGGCWLLILSVSR
ncbi:hypothetical protein NDI49_11155 [Trichocoleus sp. ST-U3]|uniref:hypothetical protein n=1 Tax=Coleofasciculus sp. FACHB-542 TaxID=2692787 RepID=UPI0016884553|nr:hypothetical protein [Coleofasciculus sp. FACHB-542]MBD2084988.1 hypothetical protein [Coleofasciculus sp. FACHB-542]